MRSHGDLVSSRARAAALCRRIVEGDVWVWPRGSRPEVTIERLEHDDSVPWPLACLLFADGKRETWGAPAFISAQLVSRGTGRAWDPPRAVAA